MNHNETVKMLSKIVNIILINWENAYEVFYSASLLLKYNDKDVRIIIVDNASPDRQILINLIRKLQKNEDIVFIENSTNLGYAGANNLALEYLNKNKLDGDLLILNSDVTVTSNTLAEMRAAKTKNVGGVMCRTCDMDGKLLYDAILLKGYRQIYQFNISKDEVINTDYLAGSCMLLDRDVLKRTGLFPEDFFMYWEDVDLSLKFKKLGLQLVSTRKTYVKRKSNPPVRSANALYYSVKNGMRMIGRYENFTRLSFLRYFIRINITAIWVFFRSKDVKTIIAVYRGLMHRN